MSNWWTKNPVVANFIKKCERDYTFDFSVLLSHKVIPITNFFTDFILIFLSYKYYQNNPSPLC